MDEILTEVRKIRDALVAEHNHDLHALCEDLRQKETAHKDRLVDVSKKTKRPESSG